MTYTTCKDPRVQSHPRPASSWHSRLLLLALLFFTAAGAQAQAPTALQYPTPNGFIANVTNVYLAPTLSGSTAGLTYSITPALPAGLSFSSSTGAITGLPTAASNATTYTVTASNTVGSMSTTLVITVTNAFLNNNFNPVNFKNSAGATDTLQKIGNGQHVGDIILYRKVATIGGQDIDCIVKTVGVVNVDTFYAYDQPLTQFNPLFNSNDPNFFSPMVGFGTGGGSLTFEFQFIAGGTYVNATNSGTNVTLQNVRLNTYDIDGNGTPGSNQYARFEGFDSSEISSATTLNPPSYDATSGLTTYMSAIYTNTQNVTDDATRVRLKYSNMSNFRIQVGGGTAGVAFFFLDFSTGPSFSTGTKVSPPTVDLNTTLPGTGNGASGCANALAFTAASQINVASGTALNELSVTYRNTSSNLPDGAAEVLYVKGGTPAANNTIPLNFTSAGTSSVTVAGVTYTITKSLFAGFNTISFATASTFTVANAEALLDSLRYDNTLSVPSPGERVFTVNVRNSQYTSPDAVFVATLKCVSVSGNIFHDVNAQTDGLVNASATGTTGTITGQFAAGATSGVYAVLTLPTGTVLNTVPVTAGGAYTFGRVDPGNYNIYISNTATPPAVVTAATYPTAANYKSTGENLGATAGTDGLTDGKLSIVLGTVAVTNANFGLQIPPVTADSVFTVQANPGGFNYYTIPAGGFKATDADGSLTLLVITAFPAGANYLKVGSIFYTAGGTCPPQSACTAWPGTLTVPYSTVGTIAVDPALPGTTSVSLTYKVIDNGAAESNNGTASTITIPFANPTPAISISGNVWDDANADGVKDAAEAYTAAARPGQTLYAVLVQTTNTYSDAPTIYAATPVTAAATGYTFTDVPAGNGYQMRLVSAATAPVAGAALNTIIPALATGFTGVSTNNNGTTAGHQYTDSLINNLGTVTASKTGINFGIEQTPVADAKAFFAPTTAFTQSATPMIGGLPSYAINAASTGLTGPAIKSLSGTDAEDCATASSCTTARSYKIQTVNANTLLYYNGSPVTAGAIIPGFSPANLTIYGQKGQGTTPATALGFTYSLVDNAGIASPAVNYLIQTSGNPLPVTLTAFTGDVAACTARLYWQSATESNSSTYEVEQSRDGRAYEPVATIASHNSATGGSYTATVTMPAAIAYYRLKMTDLGGAATYSAALTLKSAGCSGGVLMVSPNPASGVVRISGLQSAASVMIYDATGKMVMALDGIQNNQPLDISILATGTYTIRVADAAHNTTFLKINRL